MNPVAVVTSPNEILAQLGITNDEVIAFRTASVELNYLEELKGYKTQYKVKDEELHKLYKKKEEIATKAKKDDEKSAIDKFTQQARKVLTMLKMDTKFSTNYRTYDKYITVSLGIQNGKEEDYKHIQLQLTYPTNWTKDKQYVDISKKVEEKEKERAELSDKVSELNIKLANISREERYARAMLVKQKLTSTAAGKALLDSMNPQKLLTQN